MLSGVKVAVQVMPPSVLVSVVGSILPPVVTMPPAKPVTASLNLNVMVAVSPAIRFASSLLMVRVGATVSTLPVSFAVPAFPAVSVTLAITL